MSKQITILFELPVVFTKDKNFKPKQVAKPGAIFYLPDDAVLAIPPQIISVETGAQPDITELQE